MANLSQDRLYLGHTVLKRNNLTGEILTITRHTYESHKALYDIDIYPNGSELLQINCKPIDTIPVNAIKYFDYIRKHISTPMQSEPYGLINKVSTSEFQNALNTIM